MIYSVCDQRDECFHEECNKHGKCFLNKTSCPFVHLCTNKECKVESICQDPVYWSHYWRKKAVNVAAAAMGISKSKIRKEQKAKKKGIGQKKARWNESEAIRRTIVSSIPLCVKKGDYCDKMGACVVLGQCIVTLPRVLARPELLESLRGPRTAKEIIQLLREYDPEPMKSYYLNSK